MVLNKIYTLLGLALVAQQSFAGDPVQLPLEMGGVAAVAALSLIIATQLIKRRK
jgi:hypothetical protein